MAATWILPLCLLACGVTSAQAAALKHVRHKRETLSSGWLASPGYPNTFYPNDCKQDFTIQTDPSRPCTVTIRYVADIEWASGCVYDRLVLNAGRPDERVVCGNTNDQVVTYTTTVEDSQGVHISFSSDSTQAAKGYRLEYTVEPLEPAINTYSQYNTDAPQGRAIDDGLQSTGNYASERWGNSGTFSSPSYPSAYPGNYDGTYLAHLDYNGPQTVRVNYQYDIEYQENCLFDYLEYVNTGQRVCGNSRGTVDIPVSGNTFELRFHSDNSDNRQGFTLDYQVVPQFQSRSLSLSSDTSSGAVTEVPPTTPSGDGGPASLSTLPPTDGGSGTSTESGSTASTEVPVARNAVVNPDSDTVVLQEAAFVTTTPVVSASPQLVSIPVTETDVLATYDDQVCDLCEWRQYGDYDYSYNQRMLTFDDAVAACRRCGGQLVSAVDQDQFDLTQRIFFELSGTPDLPHWLAATDRGTEGQWTWLDGTPLSYTQWKRREPDNQDDESTNADCLVVNSNGDWRDQECTNPRKSLCRRPLGLEVPCIPSPDYPEGLSGTEQGAVTPPSVSDVMDVDPTAGTTHVTPPPPPPPTTLPPQPPPTPLTSELPLALFPEEPLVTSPVNQLGEINVFVPAGEECCSLSEWRAYGDLEYSYNPRGLTFDQAVSACASCGGQLITAANEDEFALTQRIFATLSGAEAVAHWLAATDRGTEGQWTWLDGTPLSYTHWKRREPDGEDEDGLKADCLLVNSKGLWRDQSCLDTRRSLCKRPTGTVVSPLDMCLDTDSAAPTSPAATTSPPASFTTTDSRPTSEAPQSPAYSLPSFATTNPPTSTPFFQPITNNYDSTYIPSERPYFNPTYETTTSTTNIPPATHDFFLPHTTTSIAGTSDNSVSGNSGYITSPNYPGLYPSNQDYEVKVTLEQAGPQTVILTLDDFDVEWHSFCAYDYVIINGDVSNMLCGLKSGQEIEVEVPGDSFTLTLHSDGSVEQRGFNISYTVARDYTTDLGNILERGYTYPTTDFGTYPPSTADYAYPSYGNNPTYATDYMYPSYGNYPSYATDYVYPSYGSYPSYTTYYGYNTGYTDSYTYPIYNYGYPSSAYYPSYTADYGYGNYGSYPSDTSSYGNNNGYSSYSINSDAYNDYGYADYGPVFTTDSGSGSGSGSGRCPRREYQVSGDSGYLKSPNYPGGYASNEDFEMTVTLHQPGPQTVYLDFHDFDVEWNSECTYDYVIINGDVSNKLCGLRPGERMEAEIPGNTFTLTFHSDRSVENRGFDIYYTNSKGTSLLGGLWQQTQDVNGGLGDTLNSWQSSQQALPSSLGSAPDTPLPTIPTRPPQVEPTPFFFPDYSLPSSEVPPVESRPLEIPQSLQQQSATQALEPLPYYYAFG